MINSFGYKNLEALILQMFVWLGARNVVEVVGNSCSWLILKPLENKYKANTVKCPCFLFFKSSPSAREKDGLTWVFW